MGITVGDLHDSQRPDDGIQIAWRRYFVVVSRLVLIYLFESALLGDNAVGDWEVLFTHISVRGVSPFLSNALAMSFRPYSIPFQEGKVTD